jgi:prepilin-type N-terminal cleavage/methylation domain-containing protein
VHRNEHPGDGVMSAMQRRFRRQLSNPDDSGLTLVELVVVMIIIAVVMSLASLLIVNVNRQSSDMLDTVTGIDSQSGADQQLISYLRASTELLGVYNSGGHQIGPSASELDMVVNDGFGNSSCAPAYLITCSYTSNWGSTAQAYQSNCTNIDALWSVPTSPANADAVFQVATDLPSTGLPNQAPWSAVAANGTGPYSYSPASPCKPSAAAGFRTISSYFALSAQVDPVFTYWAWSTTATSTTSTTVPIPNIPPGLVQLPLVSGVLPACAIPEVAAVGVHVTFLAGPQTPKEGYAADEPTTLNTLVFLIGSSTSGATTTTTTSTTVVCPE